MSVFAFQPESDGSRSGSSLSLRGNASVVSTGGGPGGGASSPARSVHRSVSATAAKPSRRASSGAADTLRESLALALHYHTLIPPTVANPQAGIKHYFIFFYLSLIFSF